MSASQPWSDQKIETIVGNLLRIGVSISAAVVAFGGLLFLMRHGVSAPAYHTFRGEPQELRSLHGIGQAAFTLQGRGMIQLGLLLLIATPVVRVAFSIWAFAAERDRMYVGFTIIVLAVLLYSLLGTGTAF